PALAEQRLRPGRHHPRPPARAHLPRDQLLRPEALRIPLPPAARPVKRFYKAATVGEGNAVLLDGRPVRTPGRAPLAVPGPSLAWAQDRYASACEVPAGITHSRQPPETGARLAAAVAARGPVELAGLSPLVTVSGSLIIALALAEGALGLNAAWAAAALDEQWQIEQWGEDEEAVKALAARRADFAAAARFLALLQADRD